MSDYERSGPTDDEGPPPTQIGTVRHQEALEFLNSIEDPITRRLVQNAHFFLLRRFTRGEGLPVGDFDVRFFVEVLREFCQEHEVLKRILAGERVGAWWDENEK